MTDPHPIPDEALNSHIAILGKTGSGKSNAAKTIVEQGLEAGERVCIIDPTGSWYGLRLKANGKPSGYPVVIFGGHHADKQISGRHGEAIAEVVATSSTPAVIDTRLMSVGERTAFFRDFAETLLRRNRGPLRLVIDEAHLFAPQSGGAGGRDVARNEMLHAANNLVSLGRSIGLRIVLISQRPAKLHKDSLTQVETMVAMRLIHNLDVDAVKAWIGEWADPSQGKEIVASLPSLPTGDAWIWSPEIGVLKRAHFPLARTYDSGKAPSGDEAGPELQPIDLERIDAMLDKAAADIKANDPKTLKAEVTRLTRELAAAQKGAAPSWPDQREDVARLIAELEACQATMERLTASATELQRRQQAALAALGGEAIELPTARPAPRSVSRAPAPARAPVQRQPAPAREPRQSEAGAVSSDVPADLPPRHRRILDAIAWCATFLGRTGVPRGIVAWVADVSSKSSSYANDISALRTRGLIDYPAAGEIALTGAGSGIAAWPDTPPTREALRDAVSAQLAPRQANFLSILWTEGRLTREELAEKAGVSAASSSFANDISRLRTLGVLDYPAPGEVALGTIFNVG